MLNGADGVVFVADAQRDRLADNLQSLRELAHNLTNQGSAFSISHWSCNTTRWTFRPRYRLRCSTAT